MAHTIIETEYMNAQIAQARTVYNCLPKITEALERIAMALEISQGYNHSPKEETK